MFIIDGSNQVHIRAYLLAKSDPLYQGLSSRIHSMYFLATPHRGSNSAVYLKTFLSVSLPTGSKAYAKELLPDSQTVAVSGLI